MKKLIVIFCLILSGEAAQAQLPTWNEGTRKMLINNMIMTGTYTGDEKKQNAMLDTLTARMFRTLGEDKEGNTKVYKLNVYYDKKLADAGQRFNIKFDDYLVVVETNRGVAPYTIKHPNDPTRELTSAQGVVPWTLKPTYELASPTNAQIKKIIKEKDKDLANYNWARNGGLYLKKTTAATKKLVTQYSKK